jgi:hypothetical protein
VVRHRPRRRVAERHLPVLQDELQADAVWWWWWWWWWCFVYK